MSTEASASLQRAMQLLRSGDAPAARALLQALVERDAGNVAAHLLLGVALLEQGLAGNALAQFDQALALRPDDPVLHCHRGNALDALGRPEQAASSFAVAIERRPGFAEAHFNLGNAQRKLGLPDLALASYARAAELDPRLPQPRNNAASLLHEIGRLPEALDSVDGALAIDPGHRGAMNNRAIILHALGRFDEAAAAYESLVARQGADAGLLNRLGVALHMAGRIPAALESYDRAISYDGRLADAWNNRGNALHDLRRMEDARASFQRAIELAPDHAEAINNRGMVEQDLQHFAAARDDYDRAISHRPAYAEAFKRRAGLNLLEGRFAEGWADFERSLALSDGGELRSTPRWHGEDLRGKALLLSEPSGLGDTLQFFRYLVPLLARGARVSFLGPPHLRRLLSSFPGDVELLESVAGRRFDFRSTLWALPHFLWAGHGALEEAIPYLHAEPARVQRWAAILPAGRINVGICWQGNPARKIDAGRSIPLANFLPLSRVPGVNLVSLQKRVGVEQLATLPEGMHVQVPEAGFDDGPDAFVDSAALLQSLDLVVAADTAVVHLAGALGRPAWLALTRVPDWRWMLERSDSPWYPRVRLFRQSRLDDWAGVFAEMAVALGAGFTHGVQADKDPSGPDASRYH